VLRTGAATDPGLPRCLPLPHRYRRRDGLRLRTPKEAPRGGHRQRRAAAPDWHELSTQSPWSRRDAAVERDDCLGWPSPQPRYRTTGAHLPAVCELQAVGRRHRVRARHLFLVLGTVACWASPQGPGWSSSPGCGSAHAAVIRYACCSWASSSWWSSPLQLFRVRSARLVVAPPDQRALGSRPSSRCRTLRRDGAAASRPFRVGDPIRLRPAPSASSWRAWVTENRHHLHPAGDRQTISRCRLPVLAAAWGPSPAATQPDPRPEPGTLTRPPGAGC